MRLLYHASPVMGIETLEPRISNHGVSRVYFSEKRENTLVYLSNAIEKYCKETGFQYNGRWHKWGPYGFTADHRFQFQEYYPNALAETYKGVSGYIYAVSFLNCIQPLEGIPGAYYSSEPVNVVECENIKDAYAEFMAAYHDHRIDIMYYENWSSRQIEGNRRMMQSEYEQSDIRSDYKYFLENKFPWLKNK